MVCTFTRKKWYHFRVQSSFFCQWYIPFLDRANITTSPKFVWTGNSAFQLWFLSIDHMNVWLWNSDSTFVVALVNCFSTWNSESCVRPSVNEFHRWGILPRPTVFSAQCCKMNLGADRAFLHFDMSQGLLSRHIDSALRHAFCTGTAAHPPLFC